MTDPSDTRVGTFVLPNIASVFGSLNRMDAGFTFAASGGGSRDFYLDNCWLNLLPACISLCCIPSIHTYVIAFESYGNII